jgi:hypothetical protein
MTPDPRAKQLPEAELLRRNAGVWVRLEEAPTVQRGAGNRASEIRAGRPAAFRPERHYEATSRGRHVWVRWVGPDGPQAWSADPPPRPPRETTQAEENAA